MKNISKFKGFLAAFIALYVASPTSNASDEWVYNDLLGYVNIEHFPWLVNDMGWIYTFSKDSADWDGHWAYIYGYGWYWAGRSTSHTQWVYTLAFSEAGYISGDQFRASVRGQPIVVENESLFPANVEGDPFELSALQVMDGKLILEVDYEGGCSEHFFALLLEKSLKESIPVQAHFHLVHNSNGDTCEGLIQENLEFDISSYLEDWAGDFDQVLLVVNDKQSFGSGQLLISLQE